MARAFSIFNDEELTASQRDYELKKSMFSVGLTKQDAKRPLFQCPESGASMSRRKRVKREKQRESLQKTTLGTSNVPLSLGNPSWHHLTLQEVAVSIGLNGKESWLAASHKLLHPLP
ncbi:unnamed protein product [Haemonchus placei]|uniref:Uncharacterized protein n=1 Tax=Haemonchus placei TaxID=6290 RepID=A0A0N4VYG0_HAEPC|nr:unnamed protein product [Haemonchus placei]